MLRWKRTPASKIGTRTRTSTVALVFLLTLSSRLLRDVSSFVPGGAIPSTMRRSRLVHSVVADHVEIYERADLAEDEKNSGDPTGVGNNKPFRHRNFVELFHGSANYVASHRDTLVVFHLPGDLIEEHPAGFRDLMNDIALSWLLGIKIVIVAGCRYQINKRREKDSHGSSGNSSSNNNNNSGRQVHMGMLVTDQESLQLVKEEAGYVRFEVERQLSQAMNDLLRHGNDHGNKEETSGVLEGNVVSGNFYSAQPYGVLDGVDYQYSGFVRRMEVDKIHHSLQNRDIVLLTSLGPSPTGEVFNVDSEYLAAHAAAELGASKIIYFLEKNAALRHKIHGSDISYLRIDDGRNLLDRNGVRTKRKGFVDLDGCPFDDGAQQKFLVKLGWGMNALGAGVKRVHLISPYEGALLQELYTRTGSGTMISSDLYEEV